MPDLIDTQLAQLLRTEDRLTCMMKKLGIEVKASRIRVTEKLLASFKEAVDYFSPDGLPPETDELRLKGIPIICDLPPDHPSGFVIVYEA